MKNTASRITSKGQVTVLDYVGFFGRANLPDDAEELLTSETGKHLLERD